ncbi:MAG: YoaP domain-containing protein [Lachnospiraceae bacterium]|nr:YoaP domain-containing protein [Lachnospiraceae bacterium]
MNYIRLTEENLDREHICCAISGEKDPQVVSKKEWLKERIKEGLVFLKADVRGKCFIEYMPAEYAWVPIEADGYMHINCFWVSGSCKGHGHADELLGQCIADAKEKGKCGITVISSPKKKPFLMDPEYLSYKGFQTADEAAPYFTLMYLPFTRAAGAPKFKDCAKRAQNDMAGFSLYYTSGCPYTAKYVPILEKCAEKLQVQFTALKLDSRERAQNAPSAWTNFALFYNGRYITHEILSEKKFLGLIEEIKGAEKRR